MSVTSRRFDLDFVCHWGMVGWEAKRELEASNRHDECLFRSEIVLRSSAVRTQLEVGSLGGLRSARIIE